MDISKFTRGKWSKNCLNLWFQGSGREASFSDRKESLVFLNFSWYLSADGCKEEQRVLAIGLVWNEHRFTLRRVLMSVNTVLMISNEGSAQSTLIPVSLTPVVQYTLACKYLLEFSKKSKCCLWDYQGQYDARKKPEAKNSWHCPYNGVGARVGKVATRWFTLAI
jgi:hypothetical protein